MCGATVCSRWLPLCVARYRLTINTVMGMFGGALVYYVALLATGGTMAYFMYQTLAKGCDMRVGTQGNYLAIGYAPVAWRPQFTAASSHHVEHVMACTGLHRCSWLSCGGSVTVVTCEV